MRIYAVVDKGRVHIAKDTEYLGSINSYNNIFTKIFAKIFCLSEKVKIDGVVYQVNRKEYAAWKAAHMATLSASFDDLQSIANSLYQGVHVRGTMRENISPETAKALFKNLIFAIDKGDQARARELVGQGASFDSRVWLLPDPKRPFIFRSQHSWETVCRDTHCEKAKNITALGLALEKSLPALSQFLLAFGASRDVGVQFSFGSRREVKWIKEYCRPQITSTGIRVYNDWRTRSTNPLFDTYSSDTSFRTMRYEWTNYFIKEHSWLHYTPAA